MAKDFTIHLREPTFHEASEEEQRVRLNRILAIIRRELPNILGEENYAILEKLDAQGDGLQAEAEHADDE